MLKLPEATNRKSGDACVRKKKGTVPAKRRYSISLKLDPSDCRPVLPSTLGFACGLCLLPASRHADNTKHHWTWSHWIWTYQPPEMTNIFQRLIWEKQLFSNSPGRNFSLQSSHAKIPIEIKYKLKRYLLSPPSFLILPLQPSQTRRYLAN